MINRSLSGKSMFKSLTPAEQLLAYVSRRISGKFEKRIQENPEMLFQKGSVTDDALRTFKSISPLQYALWAHDVPVLYRLLLSWVLPAVPKKLKTQIRQALTPKWDDWQYYQYPDFSQLLMAALVWVPLKERLKVLEQWEELKKAGTEHGSAYDFSLIRALEEFVEKGRRETNDWRRTCWLEKVGGEQRRVPLDLVYIYLSHRVKEDYNHELIIFLQNGGGYCSWYPLQEVPKKLGKDFAFSYSAGYERLKTSHAVALSTLKDAKHDLHALQAYARRREEQLARLKTILEETPALKPVSVAKLRC